MHELDVIIGGVLTLMMVCPLTPFVCQIYILYIIAMIKVMLYFTKHIYINGNSVDITINDNCNCLQWCLV